MLTNVSGEAPFSVLTNSFSISPSEQTYTLNISADGINYSPLFTVAAGQTRLVSGVASGSYYKLVGNESDVVVNWERNCGGGGEGGGSEYILPAATQSTLGGVKVGVGLGVEPDGELWVNVDDILPAMDRLQRVLEFPSDANIGDAVAKIRQEDEEIIREGVQFTDGIDLTRGVTVSYIYVDDANGVEFGAEGGRWSISWANETFNLNLVDGEDNITGVYSIVTKGDSEDGWTINIVDGDDNVVWSMFIEKVYEIRDDNGFGSDYTVPAGREGTVNYKEVVTKDIPEGVYQYDGTDWVKSGIVNLDNLNGTGREGEIYEYNGRFFKWVEGAGATGKWLGANIGNANYNSSGESVHSLIYTQLPTNILLCVFRRIGTDVAYLAYDGNNLVVYSDETLTTTIDTIYPNETEHHLEQNGNWYITWVDGLLTIRATTYSGVIDKRPLYDYHPHFVALNIDTLAHPTNVTTSDSDSGLPVWNKEGVIIGKNGNLNVYRMKINSTGWTGSRNFYAPETYATESWYFPKQGGTAGQVLTSAGDAEPQWATIIKAQQISSAAYEALAVKDPNTLYLIVN